MVRFNDRSTALRLADVQQPKIAATLSLWISFFAFSANVGQSDAPSSTTASSFLPSTPPAALTSSIASSSASLTDTSLTAMVPLRECRIPTLIVPLVGAAALLGAFVALAAVVAAELLVVDLLELLELLEQAATAAAARPPNALKSADRRVNFFEVNLLKAGSSGPQEFDTEGHQ